jgi:uncharacterized membrane protein
MSKEMAKGLIGITLGLVIGILFLTIGFWKTVLLAGLGAAGWLFSGARQLPQGFFDFLARIKFPWD